ncbi:MAG: GrpB family protein [Anaerolineaceae bacterium]|nr:GrpB family protein [Anaerolineaceae bacterium]
MIEIVQYQPAWAGEFQVIGSGIRAALGALALRIDHIGSTSVPGLAAKDRVDIQITVQSLDPILELALRQAGYERSLNIFSDHIPPGGSSDPADWVKWFFNPSEQQRATNVHVRVLGLPNQRYPLLFRDFLRATPAAANAYAQVKIALAKYHPDDLDAYYDVKNPVCDIIVAGAEEWAEKTGWKLGPSDC